MIISKPVAVFILLLVSSISTLRSQNISLADDYFLKANDFKKNMKPDSALVYYEKAAIEFEKSKRVEQFIDAYNQLGIILTRQDKYEKAKTYLDKALSTGLTSLDANNLTVATTYISLGVICNAEEKYEQSLVYHYKALAIRLAKLNEFHADVATSYGNIGNVHRNNKEFDKSIEAHSKALKIRENVFGLTSPEIVESYVGLGNAYKQKKEYNTSLEFFEKALKNKILQRGEGHKDLVRFYKYISEIYYLLGNQTQGDEFKMKWEQIEKK
jgi:tetratricopeptide (TPR) repeat protein